VRDCDIYDIGASLFVPASHKNLTSILTRKRYTQLQSVVIDFEDGLEDAVLQESLAKLPSLLSSIDTQSPYLFLRPRNVAMLHSFLQLPQIQQCDGFVLPKFSIDNAPKYIQLLKESSFLWMPSIEGEALFNLTMLQQLKELLQVEQTQILAIRFGLEDMLKALGMRRKCQESVFDFAVTQTILGNFLACFKSAGFVVTGGVYPCFLDDEGFTQDIYRDIQEGLFGKTIIHPNQIVLAKEAYKVTQEEYEEAKEILQSTKKVFNQGSKMAETPTMTPHAKMIMRRFEVYGVRD
jgi:citrate lyase beta subunit